MSGDDRSPDDAPNHEAPADDAPRDDAPSDDAPRAPDEESERFVKDVLTRGEAAAEGEELKPGQTHEVVVDEDGKVRVRRRRFSLTDGPGSPPPSPPDPS